MKFTKMQGLGNDYLYVQADALPENAAALSRRLSDRHFGVGADGMIWILPSNRADLQMRIFNADGSEAQMCGNGIRCVGKYAYEKGLIRKTALTVETGAGIRTLQLTIDEGCCRQVSVRMGRADVQPPRSLTAAGRELTVLPVNMGNPHAVCFDLCPTDELLRVLGPAIERHPAFPEGVNAEFAALIAPSKLRMRVWERGSGMTMACGTGACAAAAAAVECGLCAADCPITVQLDGGALQVLVASDRNVTMTGPAETVFEGEVEL